MDAFGSNGGGEVTSGAVEVAESGENAQTETQVSSYEVEGGTGSLAIDLPSLRNATHWRSLRFALTAIESRGLLFWIRASTSSQMQ